MMRRESRRFAESPRDRGLAAAAEVGWPGRSLRAAGLDSPEVAEMAVIREQLAEPEISTFAKNLRWEIDNSRRLQSDIAKEIGTSAQNFSRWVTGQYRQPNRQFLAPLANLFGYDDPESILRSDHIQRRKQDKPTTQIKETSSEIETAASFTDLLSAINRSINTSDDAAVARAKSILNTPLRPYLLIAINWLDKHQQ